MNDHTTKLIRINGFDLTSDGEGEPLILDVDLGRALGFDRPRNIRKLILRLLPDLGRVCSTVEQTPGGGRPATVYRLTEDDAVFVAARAETPKGAEVLRSLIATCREYRRMMSAPYGTARAPLPSQPSVTGRMGDAPETRKDLRKACEVSAKAAGVPVQRVYGLVRRVHGLSSHFYLPPSAWPQMRELLYQVAMGQIVLSGKPAKLHLVNPRQLRIPQT